MHSTVSTIAVIGYVCATGLALAYLIQRQELIHRLAVLATTAGWAAHTVALIVQAVEMGRPPLGTLSEAVSVAVWVVVLLEMWIERQNAEGAGRLRAPRGPHAERVLDHAALHAHADRPRAAQRMDLGPHRAR